MRAWFRCVHGTRGVLLLGLTLAVGAAVGWEHALSQEPEEYQEPPTGEPPLPGQTAPLPNGPFVLPSPTPLQQEQAPPFVPAGPFAGGNQIGPPIPMVRLRIQAPGRVEPDKEIEYRITVENVSAAEAHHVVVRDRLPKGVDKSIRAEPNETEQKKSKDGDTDLLWELGTLKPGDQKVIVLTVKPKGNEEIQNRAYVQFEHGQKVTTRIAKPGVSAKASAPPKVMLFEAITFRIEVANTGSSPLRDVVVNDELPAGLEFVGGKPEPKPEKPLTWKLGDVPPQQTRHIEYQAIARQTGTFRNNAKVTANGGASTAVSTAVSVREAKLKISVSGPQRRLVNRPIPCHITVGNTGSVPLSNVQVSDELPPNGVEFVSADAGGKREGGFVNWSLGSLLPGEVRSLHLVLRIPRPGSCWDQAKAQADHDLSDKARTELIRVEAAGNAPVIEIDKNTDQLVVGQKTVYTIRLYHPGTSNVLNPRLIVAVPDEMSLTAERGETTGQRQGQKVVFDPLKVLAPKEEKVYTIEVVAKKAGKARLRAWWTDERQAGGQTESWEDVTVILDPTHQANRLASEARYYLSALRPPRSPSWTWEE